MPSLKKGPRISFGIIVLNGEPFTRYCLRQIYPHAHEIIVVEGGSSKAVEVAPNGHSTDGTLEILEKFKRFEDPEDKVRIVTKAGFWEEKDEQSRAYADQATGDYLWQVDIDEFYRHRDIELVREMLADKSYDAVSFKQHTFWGSLGIVVDSFRLRADGWDEYHRLFRWGNGYRYVKHRPPTVVDNQNVDLRKKKWMRGRTLEKRDIVLFHYSLLFPRQVAEKCAYYATKIPGMKRAYAPSSKAWAENGYFRLHRPFRVHNVYTSVSWLRSSRMQHPEQAIQMWDDVNKGIVDCPIRENDDVHCLLRNPFYRLAGAILNLVANAMQPVPVRWIRQAYLSLRERM